MKTTNYILAIIIILSLAKASFGQAYFPFPDSNAVWSVDTAKYIIKGDSLFNSINYKKYYFTTDTNLTDGSLQFKGLVRQDITNKKVFGIKVNQTTERLLYDFNLGLNDTASVYLIDYPFFENPYTIKVVGIDSILIVGGQYRKRLAITGYYTSACYGFWIEGIGDTFGPLNPGLCGVNTTDFTIPTLLCQKQNENLIYINPTYTTCYYNFLGVGMQDLQKGHTFSVYPNPANNELKIEFECTGKALGKMIEIKNVLGQTVKTIDNRAFTNDKNKIEIDVSELSKGLYFLNLQSENKFMSKKFIKE